MGCDVSPAAESLVRVWVGDGWKIHGFMVVSKHAWSKRSNSVCFEVALQTSSSSVHDASWCATQDGAIGYSRPIDICLRTAVSPGQDS